MSEALALKWSDVDWLNGTLLIERGIVRWRVGSVKTAESDQKVSVDPEMFLVTNARRQATPFASESDWIFASPGQIGRLPVSYPLGMRGSQGWNSEVRKRIRSVTTIVPWPDAETPIAVQQKLRRHSDIRTTLNVYGDVVTDEMAQANSRVARMALSRAN